MEDELESEYNSNFVVDLDEPVPEPSSCANL
jgi:hypothetical protein